MNWIFEPDMNWIFENAEKLGGLATVVAALVAILATCIAVLALLTGRNSQREATAKDIYRDYLKLAFDNPEIAIAHRADRGQEEKYQWFVAFLLTSCDEIVRIMPRDKTWRKGIRIDLKPHLEYFRSREFEEDGGWDLYSRKLKAIADEAFEMVNSKRAEA
jgi:hypothetical protein